MEFEPYQQRVVIEKNELNDKIDRLKAFFKTKTFEDLNDDDQMLLDEQYWVMKEYSNILATRIGRFID